MLNTRGMDPRWVTHHRSVATGWMAAQITVYKVATETFDWDPLNDPFKRDPGVAMEQTAIYLGPGRVQPNKDWRARLMEEGNSIVTTHAIRVQLDYQGNTLGNGSFPQIEAQDVLRVTDVFRDDSGILTKWLFTIRNISVGSNAWVHTLLCDVEVNNLGSQ